MKSMEYSQNNLLLSKLVPHLNQLKQIITDNELNTLLDEWRRIFSMVGKANFSIAVIGEFSRGKSTIVNLLLGDDIVPIGTLPTTAYLTKIIYGKDPQLTVIKPDSNHENHPLNETSWNNLMVGDKEDLQEGEIIVKAANEWLKSNNFQIIDTPGAGDLTSKRAELTIGQIASCDAVLIAISATMPFSQTEKAFIEQHILSKEIPHIAVVLTRLDQVKKNERVSIVKYIKNKLTDWKFDIPLIVPQEMILDTSYSDISGINQLKKLLEKWSANHKHTELVFASINTQIQDLIGMISGALETRKQAIITSNSEKKKQLSEAEYNIERMQLKWEDLRIEMLNRSNICGQLIDEAATKRKRMLINQLKYEIQKTNYPREWWEKELPYKLQNALFDTANSIENALQKRIFIDIQWLNEQLSKEFKEQINMLQPTDLVEAGQFTIEPPPDEVKDLNKLRTYSRIGTGLATFGGYALFGPLGMAVSLGGGLIGEKILTDNINKQREQLDLAILKNVNTVFSIAVSSSLSKIRDFYNTTVQATMNKEMLWVNTQKQELQNVVQFKQSDTSKIDDVFESMKSILQNIHNLKQEVK